jgi:lactam utilization protein B
MMPQPATSNRKADGIMADDMKETIDQLANSLQTVTLLSTQLRQELGNSAQQAIVLEAAADRAVNALKKLQPRKKDQ